MSQPIHESGWGTLNTMVWAVRHYWPAHRQLPPGARRVYRAPQPMPNKVRIGVYARANAGRPLTPRQARRIEKKARAARRRALLTG